MKKENLMTSSMIAVLLVFLGASTTVHASFKTIAPGSSGALLQTAVHPKNSNLMFMLTELNGVFRSSDGGLSFENVSIELKDRTPKWVEITVNNGVSYAYLATSGGVYRSDDSSGTLGDHWELLENGFETGCQNHDPCVNRYKHPVQVVAIAPSNPNIIWAGIGSITQGNRVTAARLTDPYHVYASVDKGDTWHPVLSLIRGSDSTTGLETTQEVMGLTVYSIFIDPADSHKVTIGTDRGIYYTTTATTARIKEGTASAYIEWHELGRENAYGSIDRGQSWSTGSVSLCTPGLHNQGCLPVASETGVQHPHIRSVKWSDGRLYALVNDLGWAGGIKTELDARYTGNELQYCETDGEYYINCISGCSSGYNAKKDTNFNFFEGGVWYSDDKGITWTFLKSDSRGKTTPNQVRCRPTANLEDLSSTVYGFMDVNPDDKENIILAVPMARGGTNGFYEYRAGKWIHARDVCTEDTINGGWLCYEGGRTTGMWGTNETGFSPTAYGLNVVKWEPLKIHYGHIMGMHEITRNGDLYAMEHMAQEQDLNAPGYWQSTGPDVHCPHAGVHFLNGDMFIGAIDVGVLKSKNFGTSWKVVTENNKGLKNAGLNLDDSWALVADKESQTLYAHSMSIKNCHTEHGWESCNSILKSDQTGEIWDIIGGTLALGTACLPEDTDAACEGNGLPKRYLARELRLDYSRTKNKRVFLATERGGLFIYDPLKTAGAQWDQISDISDGSCSALNQDPTNHNVTISDLISFAEYPELMFATVTNDGDNTYGYANRRTATEGVYAIQIDPNSGILSCQKLVSSVSIADDCSDGENCNPMAVRSIELTGEGSSKRLVVGARFNLWPVIISANVDLNQLSQVDWKFSLDFKKTHNTRASVNWWNYLATHPEWETEYESHYFWYKQISDIDVDLHNKDIAVAVMEGNPGADQHSVNHVYVTKDAGKSWEVAPDFEDLPIKTFYKVQFSEEDNNKIYLNGVCTSAYEIDNPYLSQCRDRKDNDHDGKIDLGGCDCDGDRKIDSFFGYDGSAVVSSLCTQTTTFMDILKLNTKYGYNLKNECPGKGTVYYPDNNCEDASDNSERPVIKLRQSPKTPQAWPPPGRMKFD